MSVRLYGRHGGNGSHAVVTRGFRSVLKAEELLTGFMALDLPDEENEQGSLAFDGVFTGALNLIQRLSVNARHNRHWAVVAPNSSYLPPAIVRELHMAKVTCLAPSAWAKVMIERYDLPAMVVRHGVQGLSTVPRSVVEAEYTRGLFSVLHLSTSAGQRKGTLELIRAWIEATSKGYIPPNSKLLCVLDHDAKVSLRERLVDDGIALPLTVDLTSRWDVSARVLEEVFQFVHVVCQPSRAEGFGLVPLEALASGVPVVATACTGHAEHVHGPGVVQVLHDETAPIDDGPGAMAPTVPVDSIVNALRCAYENWQFLNVSAQENAAAVRETWSWKSQLAMFVHELRSL